MLLKVVIQVIPYIGSSKAKRTLACFSSKKQFSSNGCANSLQHQKNTHWIPSDVQQRDMINLRLYDTLFNNTITVI